MKEITDWKAQLAYYEKNEDWDAAWDFMQQCIKKYPEDMYVYLLTDFMLMYILLEVHPLSDEKFDYHRMNLAKCFQEGYSKFSGKARFLFYSAYTVGLAEWMIDLTEEQYIEMARKAHELEPENMIYTWGYEYLTNGKFVDYGHQIYNNQELIRELKDLGALGEDIIDISLAYAEEEYLKRQD